MNESEHEFAIRRILVALDASGHSLAALAAAAELAGALQAELLGLFVEDINLLRLAGLPFAQEIYYPAAVARQMDQSRLEQELRVQAAQARRALAQAAEKAHLVWSFKVVRGQVAAELLTAASEADLLSLGIASRPLSWRIRPGSTALAVAARSPRAVLLLQQGERVALPVLVAYDGSQAGQRALAMAVKIAQMLKTYNMPPLTVVVVDGQAEPEVAQWLEREAAAWLLGRRVRVTYRHLPQANIASLVQLVQAEQSGLLVLGGETPLIEADTIQALLDRLGCPVLMVR
jgi:nucleotide-binding universal stress UspA family protein